MPSQTIIIMTGIILKLTAVS